MGHVIMGLVYILTGICFMITGPFVYMTGFLYGLGKGFFEQGDE